MNILRVIKAQGKTDQAENFRPTFLSVKVLFWPSPVRQATVGMSVPGGGVGLMPSQILTDQFTRSQQGGTDYDTHISTRPSTPPDFQTLRYP